MKNSAKKIRISVKKRKDTDKRRQVEVKVDVDLKLFSGPDWLVSLGRLKSFDESLREGFRQVVLDYIKSAEEELKTKPTVAPINKNQVVNS